jgi:uncharacterized membrane protein
MIVVIAGAVGMALVVAVVVNLVLVSRIPVQVMRRTMRLYPVNQWVFARPATAKDRTIVRPSPDLHYSILRYDISRCPIRLKATIPEGQYWSISGYSANTDNFFVINDLQAKSNPIEVVLVPKGAKYLNATGRAHLVTAPTKEGIVLIRTVIPSRADLPRLREIQKQSTLTLLLSLEGRG